MTDGVNISNQTYFEENVLKVGKQATGPPLGFTH
jgi:hypothetical protein